MSASRPSTVNVDEDDDDWGAISPLPTGTSVFSRSSSGLSTTTSSGEFNPFNVVGISLSGGETNEEFGFRTQRCLRVLEE